MSMQPKGPGRSRRRRRESPDGVPEGSQAIGVRGELGPMLRDEDFADL